MSDKATSSNADSSSVDKITSIIKEAVKIRGFFEVRALLKENGYPTARTKEDLISALYKHCIDNGFDEAVFERVLKDIEESRIYGDKYVGISNFEKKDFDKLKWIKDYSLDSILGKEYPLRAAGKIDIVGHQLIKIHRDKNEINLIFSGVRKYRTKDRVPLSEIDKSVRDKYKGHKVYVSKDVSRQFFDIVSINKDSGRIEFRLDLDKGNSPEKPVSLLFSDLHRAFDQFFIINNKDVMVRHDLDFFQAIRKIYDNSDEGKISALYFECSTGVTRHENFRQTIHADLRQEIFHKEGKQAVGDIDPYRMEVFWNADDAGAEIKQVQVEFPGSISHLHKNLTLDYICIKNIPGKESYTFAIDKVASYV